MIFGARTRWNGVYAFALAAVFVLTLAGCGGGDSKTSTAPPPATMPPSITSGDVQTLDPDEILDTATRVGASSPRFGSVVQSSGNVVTGVSSRFDGQRVVATLERQGRQPVILDTTNRIPGDDTGVTAPTATLNGRVGRSWGIFSYTENSATLGRVAVDWSSNDASDYLTGGYWLYVEGDFSNRFLTYSEAGAFVDGPNLSLINPPSLPISGTASYRGTGAGLYAGVSIDGSKQIGEFGGIATFTADFSTRTIDGCIGCEGEIRLIGLYEDLSGAVYAFDEPSDVNLHLTARISGNGTFVSRSVRATSPSSAITRSEGHWGGQFSNRPAPDGAPRLVAGTFGGEIHGGGIRAVYVGAFGAGKQ